MNQTRTRPRSSRAPERKTAAALVSTLIAIGLTSCGGGGDSSPSPWSGSACFGATYPPMADSPYVLPWPVGDTVVTGLTNCSSSFHSRGEPDQYAFDFDIAAGTPFMAARGGIVSKIEDGQPSQGGGSGNYVAVDHGDGTSALYLHSPQNGIQVHVGDVVQQGQVLGLAGQSGLAGYPHLHFIVVAGSTKYPYHGVPVSFRNASPADLVLLGNRSYTALPY